MYFSDKSEEIRYKHEAMFARTFQRVNQDRMSRGESPMWVSNGYALRAMLGKKLDNVAKAAGGQPVLQGSGISDARVSRLDFCRCMNDTFKEYAGGPVMSQETYAADERWFADTMGLDGRRRNTACDVPVSPFDPKFKDRRTFREAGSRMIYAKGANVGADEFGDYVLDNPDLNLFTRESKDKPYEYLGKAYLPDDRMRLGRFAQYLSREDYDAMSKALTNDARGVSEDSIQLSLGVMAQLERRGELQDMRIETGSGPRSGEVNLVNPNGVGICIAKPGDEGYTGRVYDSRAGLSAYFSSSAEVRVDRVLKHAPASKMGPADIVAAYDYVQGRSVASPDTGMPIGVTRIGADKRASAAHVGPKFSMDYSEFKGSMMNGQWVDPKPGAGWMNRLVLDYNARSAGTRTNMPPEEADAAVERTVKESIANFRQRVGVDRLISNAMAHAGDAEYQPRLDSDDTIMEIQADCMAVLQGQRKTLLRPGFKKSDFTGEIADEEMMASDEYDPAADPVYHGTPDQIVNQYVDDMTKHLMGSWEPDEQGVRFDPVNVVNYAPSSADSIRGRDDFAELLRQSTIDPQSLKCETMAAKTLKDKLVKFDAEGSWAMKDDKDEAIRGYGKVVERTLLESGADVKPDDIRIDKNGLIQYSSSLTARVKQSGDAAKDYMTQTVTIGPVFRQDESGVVRSTYFGQGDTSFIPRSRGTIMPDGDSTVKALCKAWEVADRPANRKNADNGFFPSRGQIAWTAEQYLNGNLSAPHEMFEHFEKTSGHPGAVERLSALKAVCDERPLPTQKTRAASAHVPQGFDLAQASAAMPDERIDGIKSDLYRTATSHTHPFERLKIDSFQTAVSEKLAATVRSYAVSGRAMVEDPMVLDSVCKDFRDKRLPGDYEDRLRQGGMSERHIEAQKRAWSDIVMLSDRYSQVATTPNMNAQGRNVDPVNDNFSGVLKLTDCKPVDVTPPGADNPFDSNAWTLPGNRVNLVKKEGAHIGEDGIMTSSCRPDDMAAAHKVWFGLEDGTAAGSSVAANRVDMITKNMRNATGKSSGRTAYLNVGGYGFEDGCAVSREFANRTLVYNKHGDDLADEIVRMWNDARDGKEGLKYSEGQAASAAKAYLSGDREAAQRLRDDPSSFADMPDTPDRDEIRYGVLDKSHTRRARCGDKFETAGNKKTIGRIVEPGDTDDVAKLFHDNKLDVVVDPQSLAGRAAAFAYLEGRQHTDTLYVNGKAIPNAIVEHDFTITPHSADAKTHADGRNISAQQALIMQGAGASHLVSELYSTNERSAAKVRERLIMLNMDIDPDMTLRRGYHPHPGEIRPVVPAIQPVDKVIHTKNGVTQHKFGMYEAIRDVSDKVLSREGGCFLEVRTPLKYPDGTTLAAVPKEMRSDPNRETYMLPIPAKSIRSGSKDNPSSLARRLESIAVSDARMEHLRLNGKGDTKDFAAEQAKMQSAFSQVTGYIVDHHVKGKHNMFRDEMLRNNINGATAIMTGDPDTPLDKISMGPELAQNLNVKDGDSLMSWRDPVIDELGMVYTQIQIKEGLTGVAINPANAERFRGDFDGDTKGLSPVRSEEAIREAKEFFGWQANMLKRSSLDAETGEMESTYEIGLDIKTAFRDDPGLKARYDEQLKKMNDDEHQLSGELLDQARSANMAAMNGIVSEGFRKSFGTDVLQFGSAQEHMASMGKVTGVGIIRKGEDGTFEIMQEAGPSIKGDISKQANYAKYAGISFDAHVMEEDGSFRPLAPGEKKKSGVYIDYDSIKQHDHSLATPEDEISVQQATDIGKDVGRAGGLRQSIVKVIGQDPVYEVSCKDGDVVSACVDMSKPTKRMMTSVVSDIVSSYEQVLLDSKHDAVQAKYNHSFVAKTLPALWSGKKFRDNPVQTPQGPVYSVSVNDSGEEERATIDEFRKQFMEIHKAVGINVTPEMMGNIAHSMTRKAEDGSGKDMAMDVRDSKIVMEKASPIMALAYPQGDMALSSLYDYADREVGLFGTGVGENGQASKSSSMICFASSKVRHNIEATLEGRTEDWVGFSQDAPMRSKNGVCKNAGTEFIETAKARQDQALAMLTPYSDKADQNIEMLRDAWRTRITMDKQDSAEQPAVPFANKIELADATLAYMGGQDSAVRDMFDKVAGRTGISAENQARTMESVLIKPGSDRTIPSLDSLGTRHDYGPEVSEKLSVMAESGDKKAALLGTMLSATEGGERQEVITVAKSYMGKNGDGGVKDHMKDVAVDALADRFVMKSDDELFRQDHVVRSVVEARLAGQDDAAERLINEHVEENAGHSSVAKTEFAADFREACDKAGRRQAAAASVEQARFEPGYEYAAAPDGPKGPVTKRFIPPAPVKSQVEESKPPQVMQSDGVQETAVAETTAHDAERDASPSVSQDSDRFADIPYGRPRDIGHLDEVLDAARQAQAAEAEAAKKGSGTSPRN